jgi:hypothetical protein
MEGLGPLQRATQLEELYLTGPQPWHDAIAAVVPGMLPAGLNRLSWWPQGGFFPDLSHLTQATFLQLWQCPCTHAHSDQLPPRLQQLELDYCSNDGMFLEALGKQRQLVRAWYVWGLDAAPMQAVLPHLSKLTAITLDDEKLASHATQAALKQLGQLSALKAIIEGSTADVRPCVDAAAGIPGLRRLCWTMWGLSAPPALTALSGVTQLRVYVDDMGCSYWGN